MISDKPSPRVLIVFDGESWYVRRVVAIIEHLDIGEKEYRCDAHLGGPYHTLPKATTVAKKELRKLRRRKS
jgi:hypothetical protein